MIAEDLGSYRPETVFAEYLQECKDFSYYWFFFTTPGGFRVRILEFSHYRPDGNQIMWEFPAPQKLVDGVINE